MRSYEVARKYFSAVELCGWITIVVGVLTMLVLGLIGQGVARGLGGPTAGSGLLGLFPGLMIAMIGLISIGMAQYWRAGVDTAEYTQQMLKIARDQLEVSRQALTGGAQAQSGFAALRAEAPEKAGASFAGMAPSATSTRTEPLPPDVQKVIEYHGREILKRNDRYYVGDVWFQNLARAQLRVDELLAGAVAVEMANPLPPDAEKITNYRGYDIHKSGGQYLAAEGVHRTIGEAQNQINQILDGAET